MRLYFTLVSAALRTQMAYRRSFLLEAFGQMFAAGVEILGVFFLFSQISDIQGWTLWDIMYFYGVAVICLNVGELLTSGLDDLPQMIRDGEFDRLLVRPVPVFVQIFARNIKLFRLGKIAQGVVALVLALWHLSIDWNALTMLMLGISFVSGIVVFTGLLIATATSSFWTIESNEAFSAFTYGGVQMAQFPASIYPAWVRRLFFYVIPVGFVVYFPSLVVLGREDPLGFPALTAWLAPVVASVFAAMTCLFWKIGVNHYQSTGS